ncbi:MAG: tetratricopeptide (TPR) repeat protein [Bradymonadia bacterium]|jgi:tetratricopeptide (TPR) repeat protein
MKLSTLLFLMLSCAPLVAQGQTPDDPVKALAAEGAAHFEAERYCHAVQAYRAAYRLDPLPELLYNVAYIHDRKLNDPDVARVYYQRYVRARGAADALRLIAFERLDVMQVAGPEALGPTGGRAPGLASAGRVAIVGDAPGANHARAGAWIALGVGAAATITGATFAVLATHSHSQFEDASDAAARRQLADEGEQRALIGDIGLGVGLAGLAAGGVLYLLSSEDEGLSVGALPTPDGMRVGVSTRF